MIPRYFGYMFRQVRQRLLPAVRLPHWPLLLLGTPEKRFCGHFSRGMERIPHLAAFLGQEVVRLPRWGEIPLFWKRFERRCDALLAWGLKEATGKPAERASGQSGLPLLRLEDGFLRSLDLGVRGAPPYALVLDDTGIYYDATRPSALENLLNNEGWQTPDLLDEARAAMRAITAHNLSKYNHAPDAPANLIPDRGRPRILVLDQTRNDLSVSLGLADAETFARMLDAACREHPDADICVKTHPDVLSGRKQGFFQPQALPAGVRLLAEDVNPLSLLRQVDEVYCVTSQMGFEALLLDKKVHCFGMPFYAGWGLTQDRQTCARRMAVRSLEEVFAAAYLLYSRYVHPVTGRRCSIMEIIRLLTEQRRRNEQNRGYHACLGFRLWKHEQARAFLASTGGSLEFFHREQAAVDAAAARRGRVVVWSSKENARLAALCRERQVPLIRMEDGFIRSKGLGSDFIRPGSLVLDDLGIYYNPQQPSRLERLLRDWTPDAALLEQARALREELCRSGITKYNVGNNADIPPLPADRKILLVPGQVSDDASVRLGGCGIGSNLELLQAVRKARPKDFIIYKEHPDVVSGNRNGALRDADVAGLADAVVRHASISLLYACCHEVHTLTSQSGFEALLRGLPVFTYGGPFYAGWGLTTDRLQFPRRRTLDSVDTLVAAVLLRYPVYYDWENCCVTDCAAFLEKLKSRLKG
ncbi:capsular polysaccharide biosynthesis protein [uncultured Desulfovibrio sp.]|uniref:capsular polysaccharide biosynthesis protein n=1 Tax=uncultured Desulfovibrio sp. TaxID=167968 RepID=UPI00261673FB|nr:capsular polysaccharide biosynthesis protein [uncultured Desulfovibrio sp.]